jgi:cytochrome P450
MTQRGSCDVMNSFARKFPTSVFLDLFGMPFDGLDKFLPWEHEVLHLATSGCTAA